jgi:hypothetical protein
MKNLILLLLSSISFYSICSMTAFPGRNLAANVNRVTARLNEKNYTVEGDRRFHIGLKKNESVRYVITVPVYLSKTAIGVATDENVKKVRIVLYSQLNRESKERSFYGEDIESSAYINEITEKSYHYVVELTLLDSASNNEYSSVDLLVAYAPLPIKTEEEVKDFYYNHTEEVEFYSDPIRARNAGWRRSDTGKIPCTALDYGRTCIR